MERILEGQEGTLNSDIAGEAESVSHVTAPQLTSEWKNTRK